jgi:hypothetical protein
MGEKHLAIYKVKFQPVENSRHKRERKICKKITNVTKNICRITKLQIGLTQLIAGAEER